MRYVERGIWAAAGAAAATTARSERGKAGEKQEGEEGRGAGGPIDHFWMVGHGHGGHEEGVKGDRDGKGKGEAERVTCWLWQEAE